MDVSAFDLETRGDVADAIFPGKVIRIEYRQSEPDALGHALPFTFVTWQVERAWKGVEAGGSVTGRFIGGVTPDGLASVVAEIPLFQEGDRDVLFIDQNGVAGCPLLGCSTGRMRLIGGRVYDREGGCVVADGNGELARAGWRNLPELHVLTVGGVVLDRRVDDDTEGSGADGMMEPEFLRLVDQRLADVPAATPARSINADAPFRVRFLERENGLN